MVGAVAALTILTAGPAAAFIALNVTAIKPVYSSQLKGSGTFTGSSGATYSYTIQLVRTKVNVAPTCSVKDGCPTIGTGTTQPQYQVGTYFSYAIVKDGKGTVPTFASNCSGSSTARFYWTWLKVADSSGNVVTSTSPSLTGKYC